MSRDTEQEEEACHSLKRMLRIKHLSSHPFHCSYGEEDILINLDTHTLCIEVGTKEFCSVDVIYSSICSAI